MSHTKFLATVALTVILATTTGFASPSLRIAVAANFASSLKTLVSHFDPEALRSGQIQIIPGSSGKHYAQIISGAPFDLFFSADRRRPQKLEQRGLGVAGSRFTYAVGRLVLWTSVKPRDGLGQKLGELRGELLNDSFTSLGNFRFFAIANPKVAPYGRAAEQVLRNRGIWAKWSDKLVHGESVSQAFQFVRGGHAEWGLVAWAQLLAAGERNYWMIPESWHQPIEQQAFVLQKSPAASRLVAFLRSKKAREMIASFGYRAP